MDTKTTKTIIRHRIEPKPGGGFIARAEEGSAESLEGGTQEEVQQKIDDKLTALVGDMLHSDKLSDMVGEMLHDHKRVGRVEYKLGGAQIKVNVTTKSSATNLVSQPTLPSSNNLGITPTPAPKFESSNKLWLVIALSVALGAALMYLLKR